MDICAPRDAHIRRPTLSRGRSNKISIAPPSSQIQFKANTPIKHLRRAILYREPTHKADAFFV
jgi:hypothetical protein